MTNNNRPDSGIIAHIVQNAEVNGPTDRYALLVRPDGETRMVHYEGVAYYITEERPWTWNDFIPNPALFTPNDLTRMAQEENWPEVDLAKWCKVFGARNEANYQAVANWYRS